MIKQKNSMYLSTALRCYCLLFFLVCLLFTNLAHAKKYQVMVVMSYEQNNPWCIEIKEGIESVLIKQAHINYFYMNTKMDLKGGTQKAKEAFNLYQKLVPDGIIAADDNAQAMFVVPYLKDKVETPVMFCGVNSEPEKYGYPSANVSGTLERGHIKESIAFAKQLSPNIEDIGFLAKRSPSAQGLFNQVERESNTYLAQVKDFRMAETIKDIEAIGKEYMKKYDAIFIDSFVGIIDAEGNPLDDKQIMRVITRVFVKPIIGAKLYHVRHGALCAVVKSGQEQGVSAAEQLLKTMTGISVSQIPITRNYKGRRIINASVMEALGIKPKPVVLLGAKLVITQN